MAETPDPLANDPAGNAPKDIARLPDPIVLPHGVSWVQYKEMQQDGVLDEFLANRAAQTRGQATAALSAGGTPGNGPKPEAVADYQASRIRLRAGAKKMTELFTAIKIYGDVAPKFEGVTFSYEEGGVHVIQPDAGGMIRIRISGQGSNLAGSIETTRNGELDTFDFQYWGEHVADVLFASAAIIEHYAAILERWDERTELGRENRRKRAVANFGAFVTNNS